MRDLELSRKLETAGKASLQAAGLELYDGGSAASGVARPVTSSDPDERHLEALRAALTAM